MKFLLPAILLLAGFLSPHGFAADPAPIRLEHAFTRSAPAGGVGAFYVTIVNGGAADTLVSVTSPVAGKAELHESKMENNVMKMRGVASLAIPAGRTVQLAPGGYHVMLIALTQPLTVGRSISVTLTFEKAGPVEVSASVAKPGATGG